MILIKRPVVTEKTIKEYQNENKVTFEVDFNADKIAASKALEEAYGVKVEGAKVKNRLGKTKMLRNKRKVVKKTSDRKLMTFKLKKGDKIDIFNE